MAVRISLALDCGNGFLGSYWGFSYGLTTILGLYPPIYGLGYPDHCPLPMYTTCIWHIMVNIPLGGSLYEVLLGRFTSISPAFKAIIEALTILSSSGIPLLRLNS